MRLSYAVAMPDCRAKKMLCFRGDLDAICAQLKGFGNDGVELFVRGFITMEIEQQPDSATAARRAAQTVQALLDAL